MKEKRRISIGDLKIGEEERKVVNEVLDSGRITEGSFTREFEKNFAQYIGVKHCVAVNSGTSALMLALRAIETDAHDVLTTPLTYIADTNAIMTTGFWPVFVDVEHDFIIKAGEIEGYMYKTMRLIENGHKYPNRFMPKYPMILPVHLMGYPCQMDRICKVAKEYDVPVIEDSAQAHGTVYRGQKTGSFGTVGVFSFFVAHNIQAGEMGAVVTDDLGIAKKIRRLKANGRLCDCPTCTRSSGKCANMQDEDVEYDFDPRFYHNMIGYNFKVMDFQTAIANLQLKKAEWIKQQRQKNVKFLNDELEWLIDKKLLWLPWFSPDVSYLGYTLSIFKPEKSKLHRRKIRIELEKRGIETRPLFGCIPTQQPAYSDFQDNYIGRLPNAENYGKNAFYIGCHQYLTDDDLHYIVDMFKEVFV